MRPSLPSGRRADASKAARVRSPTPVAPTSIRGWLGDARLAPDGEAHHDPEHQDATYDRAPARRGRRSLGIGCRRGFGLALRGGGRFRASDLLVGRLDLRIGWGDA